MKNLTLKQKIAQMFITGFKGNCISKEKYFNEILETGLGGVIFFSHNIESEKQIKSLIEKLKQKALLPLFLSIDQEGGKVERTEKIHNGKKYLSAKKAYEMGISFLQNQTKEIALELKSYGMNMNFSPVLDVNTNKENPIIGERSFSSNAFDVINASKVVIKEYEKYGIITVGKHFPGHGDSDSDSHKTLPIINLSVEELENIHIKPFKEAISLDIPCIMAAHVIYPSLDSEFPASVSYNIINNILIDKLKFNGLIITDDMEMNGIKGFSRLKACTLAINAGVNMFIFRDTTKEILDLINEIVLAVENGLIPEKNINQSVKKILEVKYRYGIIQ